MLLITLSSIVLHRTSQAAEADLNLFLSMDASSLLTTHSAAWEDVWTAGIEIEGNLTIAASVNSSLYYIYSAIRDDWAYGISPGGLARDG